jgi:hypothetical protein
MKNSYQTKNMKMDKRYNYRRYCSQGTFAIYSWDTVNPQNKKNKMTWQLTIYTTRLLIFAASMYNNFLHCQYAVPDSVHLIWSQEAQIQYYWNIICEYYHSIHICTTSENHNCVSAPRQNMHNN